MTSLVLGGITLYQCKDARKSSQLPLWLQPFVVDRNNADDAAVLLCEHFGCKTEQQEAERADRGKLEPKEAKDEINETDEIKDEVKDEIKDEQKEVLKEEMHDTAKSYGTITAQWLDTKETTSGRPTAKENLPQPIFKGQLAQNTQGVCLDLDSE